MADIDREVPASWKGIRIHGSWTLFALSFLAALAVLLTYPGKTLYGDAYGYMNFAKQFLVDGRFSLLNYASAVRGYLLPLLLFPIVYIADLTRTDPLLLFRWVNALVFAGTVVLFARFFEHFSRAKAHFWQNALLAGLLLFFWYGYLAFPLSDFPALALLTGAVLLILRLMDGAERPAWLDLLEAFGAGALLAASASVRPSYQFSLYLAAALLVIGLAFTRLPFFRRALPAARRILTGAALLAGIALIMLPQVLINLTYFKTFSPSPVLNYRGQNLMLFQLYYGMMTQRADFGYLEDGQPTASASIPEPQGMLIAQRNGFTQLSDNFTLRRYLRMVRKYPFDFAAMYARHFFNGLDLVYPTPYTTHVEDQNVIYRLLNYSLWFLASWAIFRRGISLRQDALKLLLLLVIALPALLTIPGVVENRFFLPLFLLMYACVCYLFFSPENRWKTFFTWRTAGLYIVFMATCFVVSLTAFASIGILVVK